MTQKEKETLVKTLCSLIPYGVKVECAEQGTFTLEGVYKDSYGNYRVITDCEEEGKCNNFPIEVVKPYLHSLEKIPEKEYNTVLWEIQNRVTSHNSVSTMLNDWYDSKYFDSRGIIFECIAIEAPEDMYKNL